MMARAQALTRSCPAEPSTTIVICGRRDAAARYRLPLPQDRAGGRGEAGGGMSAAEVIRTPGECAPIGARRCTKREALSQGLGGGRDPLSVAARLAGRLLDPD